jgi:hypothetical protein
MEKKPSSDLYFLAGDGEMRALMRSHDWVGTPLGAPLAWPQSLRNAMELMLGSSFPMFLLWGKQSSYVYNDAYIPILGARHPNALGRSFLSVWPEIRSEILPIIERALAGESIFFENLPVTLERNGYPEQTWFTFSYSPLRDDRGEVAGAFCACHETTRLVQAERRQAFQLKMANRLRGLMEPNEIIAAASEMLGRHLEAARVGYGEIDPPGKTVSVIRDWTDGASPSIAGQTTSLAGFGPAIVAELCSGNTLRIADIAADRRSAPYAKAYAAIGTRSMLVVPLIKDGRLTSILSIGAFTPRARHAPRSESAVRDGLCGERRHGRRIARPRNADLDQAVRHGGACRQAPRNAGRQRSSVVGWASYRRQSANSAPMQSSTACRSVWMKKWSPSNHWIRQASIVSRLHPSRCCGSTWSSRFPANTVIGMFNGGPGRYR